ncbi:MAG: hypothetical protein K0B15_07605 [Lentimicrobium sp.]|nr:hypothetical protein [Lentimicrobium sp.]
MGIEIRIVNSRRLRNEFIHLPAKIHQHHSGWLPPIYEDDKKFFNPKSNNSFNHCETVMALAYSNGIPRGRIMGIIHHNYNTLKQEKTARFGFLECFNEPETASALLGFIETWAIEKGMNKVAGPYGFSDKDPQGFMIEGFDGIPLLSASCNQSYMIELTEQNGYSKLLDCFTYCFNINIPMPDIYQRVQQRVVRANRYQIIEFSNKKQLKPYVIPILELVNETYNHLYGFYPLNKAEMKEFAERYMPVLDPTYVKVVLLKNEVVAFVIGLPNMSEGIIKAKGNLFPFGWIHIIRSIKRATQLDLMLGAVKPEHQGLGLEISMGMRLLDSASKAGIKTIETHLILEENTQMRAVIERLNAPIVKRFRVYKKNLIDFE